MELRTCGTLHFIQSIRDGMVVKMRNVNACGKPALVFRTLTDICETKGSKACPSRNSPEKHADSVHGFVDRTLMELDTKGNEIVCCGSNDEDEGTDSNGIGFGKMTLRQLKERCKSEKRKLSIHIDVSPKKEDVDSQQEDEDFVIPLSVYKTKVSKSAKHKRRCIDRSTFSCSSAAVSVKTEQILESDITTQFNGYSSSLTDVKVEVPDSEFSCFPSTSSPVSISSEVPVSSDVDSLPLVKLEAEAFESECSVNQVSNSFTDCSSISCTEESSCSGLTSYDSPETIEVQEKGTMLFGEEQQCCALSYELTNDNLECIEPKSVVDAETNEPETRFELYKQPHPHAGPLETIIASRDKDMDGHLNQNSCNFESDVSEAMLTGKVDCTDVHHANDAYMPEDELFENCSDQQNVSPTISEAMITGKVDCTDVHHANDAFMPEDGLFENCSNQQNVSPTSPLEEIFSSGSFQCNSSTSDDLISVKESYSSPKQLSDYSSADSRNSCLNIESIQGESSTVEEKQSPSMVEEKSSPMKSQPSNVATVIPSSELQQPPQRLPSRRKAISPASQEGLRLAMNSADLFDEAENYKCKEKLQHEPGVVSSGTDENPKLSPKVRRPKVIIRREEIGKKLKISQKGSSHKGNSESSQFPRSVPQISTGSTSIDRCSDSAIAFSQRQMHDFESVAMKLMDELKSMKDMVEEKLLFEAYRNSYLKNEADEVRNALNNTKKVEETAKRWLSLMARDCTRFCKLMEIQKLSQNSSPSKGSVSKERKISFADESGGMLCSVNYFDDNLSSPELPCDEKRET